MSNERVNAPGETRGTWWAFAAAVLVCWLVLGLWISGQSFWLDEGMAVSKSLKPDFGLFWKSFSSTLASDVQQPLFVLSQWVWVRFAGGSEWAVRAMNWAWMALAFGYAATRTRWNRRVRLLWCALAAVSPFLAMYMDEAKGYIIHFAAGTFLYLSIAEAAGKRDGKLNFAVFSLGLLLVCGTSLTGVPFAAWAGVWLLVRLVRGKNLGAFLRARWFWVVLDAAGLAVLGGWYLHTLLGGARAAELKVPFLSSTAFLAYEWLGFSGVGPARLVMRNEGVKAALPFALPLAMHALAIAFFALEWVKVWRERACVPSEGGREDEVPGYAVALLVGLLGVVSLLAAGRVTDLAIRGRHLIVVFPAALLAVAAWADRMLASRRGAPRAAVAVLLVALAASSLALRFGDRHGKEDYRRAVAMATAALREGQCVWMSCNTLTALIYNPALDESDRFVHCSSPYPEELRAAPAPDLVLVNRPDTWDIRGALADYIAERGWPLVDEFHGFRVYRPEEGKAVGEGP